jgi:hypothetical protein
MAYEICQGALPDENEGRAAGLSLGMSALASEIPYRSSDFSIFNRLLNQQDVAEFSRNVSWTRDARHGDIGLHIMHGPNQLFTDSDGASNYTVGLNGSFNFELAPNRNGLVRFSVWLTGPFARYFKCRGAATSINRTQPQDFLFVVKPVNDPPMFEIPPEYTNFTIDEDEVLRVPRFAVNISNGGWSEDDQVVSFTIVQVGGDVGLAERWQVVCEEGKGKPCTSGYARLELVPAANRYGKASYSMIAIDSGGTDREGKDTSEARSFSLTVTPKNDQPSFSLATSTVTVSQDTTCLHEARLQWISPLENPSCNRAQDAHQEQTHAHSAFARDINMGPYENGPLQSGLGPTDPYTDKPYFVGGQGVTLQGICPDGLPCEHQSGHFLVEPLDAAQAHKVFKQLPTIDELGTLQFESRWLVTGEAKFRVRLVDSGTMHPTQLASFEHLKMDPTMTTVLSDPVENGVIRKCKDVHNQTYCDSLRSHDSRALSLVARAANISAMTSPDLYFTIKVAQINRQPSFTLLSPRIDFLEDEGSFSGHVVSDMTTDNTTSNTEPHQTTTFFIETNYSQMFSTDGLPRLSTNGTLEFSVTPDVFGPVELHITLKDDGGSLYGGRDYSETSILLVVVDSLNDAPSFELETRELGFVENSNSIWVPKFTKFVRAGPANEMCTASGPYCIMQRVSFRSVDIDNPLLFATELQVSVDLSYVASLSFTPSPGFAGFAMITFRFEDDGVELAPKAPNAMMSELSNFSIKIFATNDAPSFSLPFTVSAVSCATSDPGSDSRACSCAAWPFAPLSQCSTTATVPASTSCQVPGIDGVSVVQVAQSYRGLQTHAVRGFASSVTPVYGWLPSSLTLFGPEKTYIGASAQHAAFSIRPYQDAEYANLHAREYGSDPLGSIDSMQLAVHTASSPDGRYQYAAERETDSISVHEVTVNGILRFVDRRSHGERRLRFESPMDAVHVRSDSCLTNLHASSCDGALSSKVNTTEDTHVDLADYNVTFVCGIETFESHDKHETFLAVASGCESLNALTSNNLPPPICPPESLTAECGLECCSAIQDGTVGLWDFTEHATRTASRRANPFRGRHIITCGSSNCSYSRPRNIINCREQHDTW